MGGSPDIGSGGPKDDSITASDWMKGNEHNVVLLRIGTWKAAMAAHPRTQIQFHPKAGLPCGTLFSEARSMPALLGHPAPPCSTRHQDLHRPLPVVHGQRVKASVTMRDGGAKGEGVRAAGDGQLVAADGCARTCSSISYVSKAPAAAPAAIPPPPLPTVLCLPQPPPSPPPPARASQPVHARRHPPDRIWIAHLAPPPASRIILREDVLNVGPHPDEVEKGGNKRMGSGRSRHWEWHRWRGEGHLGRGGAGRGGRARWRFVEVGRAGCIDEFWEQGRVGP